VDATGDDAQDLCDHCPRGLALSEPGLVATWEEYRAARAAGAGAYFGAPLSRLPRRVSDALRLLESIEGRVEREVLERRREVDLADRERDARARQREGR
jgi:hypothetical protein